MGRLSNGFDGAVAMTKVATSNGYEWTWLDVFPSKIVDRGDQVVEEIVRDGKEFEIESRKKRLKLILVSKACELRSLGWRSDGKE